VGRPLADARDRRQFVDDRLVVQALEVPLLVRRIERFGDVRDVARLLAGKPAVPERLGVGGEDTGRRDLDRVVEPLPSRFRGGRRDLLSEDGDDESLEGALRRIEFETAVSLDQGPM